MKFDPKQANQSLKDQKSTTPMMLNRVCWKTSRIPGTNVKEEQLEDHLTQSWNEVRDAVRPSIFEVRRRRPLLPTHLAMQSQPRSRRDSRRNRSPALPERFRPFKTIKPPSKRAFIKPPRFEGKDNCLESHLVQFEIIAKHNQWKDSEKADFLKCSLSGEASHMLRDLDDKATYDDVVSQLRQRYGSLEQIESYRMELKHRRRKPGESLSQLLKDIRRLFLLAYPGPQNYSEIYKRNLYWEAKVKESHGNPKKLWKTLSSVLCRDQSKSSIPSQGDVNAENFSKSFSAKVESVRSSTSSATRPSFEGICSPSKFEQFQDITVDDAIKLLQQAANKNCRLHPVPTWIIKTFAVDLAPFVALLVNTSTRSGLFPSSQKRAIVTPILKKASLDANDLSNYRPVSNLSFISKILERAAYMQMSSYLQDNGLLPEKQSAYRKFHSTETALLDIMSDVHSAADRGQVTLLALLDQSAAFDVIDHGILMDRLHHTFGFSGTALSWIGSYLSGRSQYVYFNGDSSKITQVEYGVPQGSVLGPLLFVLFTADITSMVEGYGLKAHSYADDLQIYSHVDPSDAQSLVLQISSCVESIQQWMAQNRLKLNPTKTELIWLGSHRRIQQCSTDPLLIAGALIKPSSHVRDLGVIFDSDLSMSTHVNKLIGVCFFHLRQLRLIRRSLDVEATHALVRALIHSRLDYCNGVLAGLPVERLRRLQSIMKASARLVLRLPSHASVTERMHRQLHWLDIPQRITYKLCVQTFKCLHNLTPGYLSRHCTSVASLPGRAHLRSATSGQLVVPSTRTMTLGNRGFHVSGPVSWNNLTPQLHDRTISLASFKKLLKTFLFRTQ